MLKTIGTITIIILFLAFSYLSYTSDRLLRVHFLDVGQGDAVLLVSEDDKYVLIDGGPSGNVMEELGKVMPVWQQKIDLVVASHGDADHITGLVDVTERYQVGKFIYSGSQKDTLTFKKLQENLKNRNVEIEVVDADDNFQIGCCLNLDIIWPLAADSAGISENDLSVSMIVDYGEFEAYLAGDLSADYELQAVHDLNYDIEVLKASHHGSSTSTSAELLDLLDPEVAVISVGENNRYGHPHPNVLSMLLAEKLKIYRTDQQGIVTIISNGQGFAVESEI